MICPSGKQKQNWVMSLPEINLDSRHIKEGLEDKKLYKVGQLIS